MIKTWQERVIPSKPPYLDPEDIEKAMIAEIDELRAALTAAESGPLSDEAFDIVTSENQVLKAKLAALEVLYLNSLADATQWQLYKSRKDAVIAAGMGKKAMRDSASGAAPEPRMTGAALASQEPVAEVLLVDGEKVIDASMAFFDSVELGTKLYLAAGAAPTCTSDEWLANCPQSVRDLADKIKAAPVQQVFGGRVDPSYVSGPMEEAPKEQTP